MFDILNGPACWLALPPAEWNTRLDNIKFRHKLTVQRGDSSKSLTKDSQERSKIYQVVEVERRANPDIEKSTLDSGQMIFYYFIVLLSYIDYLLKT